MHMNTIRCLHFTFPSNEARWNAIVSTLVFFPFQFQFQTLNSTSTLYAKLDSKIGTHVINYKTQIENENDIARISFKHHTAYNLFIRLFICTASIFTALYGVMAKWPLKPYNLPT